MYVRMEQYVCKDGTVRMSGWNSMYVRMEQCVCTLLCNVGML